MTDDISQIDVKKLRVLVRDLIGQCEPGDGQDICDSSDCLTCEAASLIEVQQVDIETYIELNSSLAKDCVEQQERIKELEADKKIAIECLMDHGYSTGHGDTFADIGWEMTENLNEYRSKVSELRALLKAAPKGVVWSVECDRAEAYDHLKEQNRKLMDWQVKVQDLLK